MNGAIDVFTIQELNYLAILRFCVDLGEVTDGQEEGKSPTFQRPRGGSKAVACKGGNIEWIPLIRM
jgi:hypothetical protein